MNFFQSIISGLRGLNNNIFTLWANAFLAFFVPIIIGLGIFELDNFFPVNEPSTTQTLYIVALLAVAIIGTISYSGWLESLYRHQKGAGVKVGDFFAVGFKHWRPLLLGGLIVGGVISLLVALFLPAITPAIMWASARGMETPQLYLFTLLTLTVLMLPAFYLMVRWFWWAHLITIKNLAVRPALKESSRLTHLDFGTVGLLVFIYVFGTINFAALVLSGSNTLTLFEWSQVNDIYIITGILQLPIIPLVFHMIFMAKFIDLSETVGYSISGFNNKEALTELRNYKKNIDKIGGVKKLGEFWMGRNPKDWFAAIKTNFNLPNLPDRSFNRHELMREINSYKARRNNLSDSEIRHLIVMVLAWGSMRIVPKVAMRAMATIGEYEDICRDLLQDKELSPMAAYERFFVAHNAGRMQGIGPSYYTKLIYFLGHQDTAIMDQWTAKTVNLLSNKKIVKVANNTAVSQKNNAGDYRNYLDFLSQLKTEFNMRSLSETGQLIYSCSHKRRNLPVGKQDYKIFSAWRKYIVDNVRPKKKEPK